MKSILKNEKIYKRNISILLIICLFFMLITIPSTNAFANQESIKLGDSENPPEITIDYLGTTPKYPVIGDEIEVKYRITADKFNYTMSDIPKEIVLVLDTSTSMDYCSEYSETNHNHEHNGVDCSIGKMDLNTGLCTTHGKAFPHTSDNKTYVCNAKRLDMVKYAAINFVNKLSEVDNVKVSLITYNNSATVNNFVEISKNIVGEVDQNEQQRNDLIDKIKNISINSGTNLGEGIRQAAKILGDSNSSKSKNRSIIVMTDGKPSKYSMDSKGAYYLDIDGNPSKYSSDFNEDKSYKYAQKIAELIPDRKYNNIFSIGYALGKEGQGGNLKLATVHQKMGGSEKNFYATQGSAIDDIFNEIAESLILDYKFNATIDMNLGASFEPLENIAIENGRHIITLPEVKYELNKDTTNEYLPNGKNQETIEFSFKVKATTGGESSLFNDAKLKYTDVKGVEHVVPLGGPTIKVYEKLPIPIIEAELISNEVVNALPNDEIEVKYMVNPQSFEYKPNDNTEDKEVAFIVDTSSNMIPMEKVKTALVNRMLNHFLNNANTSKMKFNFITYNSEIDNLVADSEAKDYRNALQKKIESITKSNSSEKRLGEAIKKADEFFTSNDNKESIKSIVIIAAGDPTDEFPNIDIDNYNVFTLAVNNKPSYENSYTKLKDWHRELGGNDLNYFVSSSSDNNNDIDSKPNTAGSNPLAPDGDIMAVIADKLVGANFRAYTIKDVKLNFDLALNFDVVSGLDGDELNYFINVPKIRYVATGKAENSSEYLFEADPIEVSFKIKAKSGKYGTLEFGENTSTELRNYISYTMLNSSEAKNPIKTPRVIIKDKRVTIQVRDSYGELDDKYDTNDDNTESIEYLKNNIKNEFDKDYRLYGDSYADITFTGVNTNYLRYKISTENQYPNDNNWDAEIVQEGGNSEGIISGDIGKQGFLTHQSYDVSHLGLIGSDSDENLNKEWSNRELLYKYPYYDGIEDKSAETSEVNDVDGYVQKINYYNPITGKTEERWVPQTVFTEYAKIGGTYKEASKTWGYLKVDKSGTYNFKTLSDDGMRATLTVNGEEIELVDMFYLHSPLWSDTGTKDTKDTLEGTVSIELEAGVFYPIFIEYFNYGLEAAYRFMYSGPDSNNKWTNIPSTAFYSSKSKAPGEGPLNGFNGQTGVKLPEEAGTYYIAYESGNKSNGNYEVKNKGIYGPFVVTNRFELTREVEYTNQGYYELSYNIKPNDIEFTDIYRTKNKVSEVVNSKEYIEQLDVIDLKLSDIIPEKLKIEENISENGSPIFKFPSEILNGQLAGSIQGKIDYSIYGNNDNLEPTEWRYTASPFTIKLKLSATEVFEDDIELPEKVAKLVYKDVLIKDGERHNKEQYFNGVNVQAPQTSIITEQGLYDNIDTITKMSTIDVVDTIITTTTTATTNKNKPIYTLGTKLQINSRNSVFTISLPNKNELYGIPCIYEVKNGKVDKSTKQEVYVTKDDGKITISNKNGTSKIALTKDKEYIVVYKVKLSDVNADGKSTFIRSVIDNDTEKITYFKKAELPDLF